MKFAAISKIAAERNSFFINLKLIDILIDSCFSIGREDIKIIIPYAVFTSLPLISTK